MLNEHLEPIKSAISHCEKRLIGFFQNIKKQEINWERMPLEIPQILSVEALSGEHRHGLV